MLEAGDYLLICVIPGQDGLPHSAHGMVEEFTVEPAENGSAGQVPDEPSDADVSLVDFGFSAPDTFEPGDTVTVTNDGDQSHELIAFRLDEGATLAEAEAALADPTAGPPPWTAAGGIGPLAPGGSGSFPLPDQSGAYVFACVLPDVTGAGRPHHTLGMVAPVTVG